MRTGAPGGTRAATALAVAAAVVLIAGATPVGPRGDPVAGEKAFAAQCAPCHNYDAMGDGPRYTQFLPQPANLTLVNDSPAMFASIVRNGLNGTGMKPFPGVSQVQSNDLYAYIVGAPTMARHEWSRVWTNDQVLFPSAAANVYATECSGCHGVRGDGDGSWARDDPHIFPKPANFRARNSDPGRLYHIIRNGRQGAMMPPQVFKIPPVAMWELALYVNQLWDPQATAQVANGQQAQYRNPVAWNDQNALATGEQHFNLYCAGCHNAHAMGTFLAPAMHDRWWYYGGGSDTAVFSVVSKGIPGQLMPSHAVLDEKLRWDIITYVRSQGGLSDPLLPAGQQPPAGPPGTVSNEVSGVK